MAAFSDIQWCHHTMNPVEGCVKVSPGCLHCYAEERNKRFHAGSNWGPNSRRLQRSDAYWKQPYKWNEQAKRAGERHRVFCASLADVMEDHEDWIEPRFMLYEMIQRTPWLDYLFLTKRPENFHRFLPWKRNEEPWPNVWLGVTAENNEQLRIRAPLLLTTPATIRFLSMEPLLEEIEIPREWLQPFHEIDPRLKPTAKIDWVIVGGESGSKARHTPLRWFRRVHAQCLSTNTPFFMKQLGSKTDEIELGFVQLKHKKGGDPDEWPEDLRAREFPQTPSLQPQQGLLL